MCLTYFTGMVSRSRTPHPEPAEERTLIARDKATSNVAAAKLRAENRGKASARAGTLVQDTPSTRARAVQRGALFFLWAVT